MADTFYFKPEILSGAVVAATEITKFRFVSWRGTGATKDFEIIQSSTNAERQQPCGVAHEDSGSSDSKAVPVNVARFVKVEAGGAIARGAEVSADDDGKAVSGGSNKKVGVAMSSAGADGDYITVDMQTKAAT